MKHLIQRAMADSDNYVIELVYSDSNGKRTRRIVSPIRFVGSMRFLGLCLCREQPRQFYLDRCAEVRLIPAAEVMMPMPMETISPAHPVCSTTATLSASTAATASSAALTCMG